MLFWLSLGLAYEFRDQIPADPVLPGRLLLSQIVFEAAVDDLFDLVGRQLEELPFLVIVAGELVSLLPLPDFLLEETLGIACSGGLLDLVRIDWLVFFYIWTGPVLSLSLELFINLLSDLGGGFGQLLQLLVGQPPVSYCRTWEHFAERHMVELEVQLRKQVLVNLEEGIVFVG